MLACIECNIVMFSRVEAHITYIVHLGKRAFYRIMPYVKGLNTFFG